MIKTIFKYNNVNGYGYASRREETRIMPAAVSVGDKVSITEDDDVVSLVVTDIKWEIGTQVDPQGVTIPILHVKLG